MSLPRRRFVVAATAGLALASVSPTPAQDPLDGIPEGPLRDQLLWVIEALNATGDTPTVAEVGEHFAPVFLGQVPADEVIPIFGQMRTLLGRVTVAQVQPGASDTEGAVLLAGDTGLYVLLTIAVQSGSGMIGGLLLQPAEAPAEETSAAGSPVASPGASPAASPVVATAVPPTTEEILVDYQAAVDALLAAGRDVTTALLTGDDEAFRGMLSEAAARALGTVSLQDLMAELTENMVSFSFAEVSAYFAGSYTPEEIAGYYHQGTPASFRLSPEEPQTGDVPTGLWTGDIMIGTLTLGIEVTFAGTADDLSATISIPEQGVGDHPLSDVRFDAERPVGALMDERALPMGPSMGTSSYGAVYEWGDMLLTINSAFHPNNMVLGIMPVMQVPLPPDPAADVMVTTTFRLPFDGAWMVIWGGESEFRNYHSPVPQQRFAHDIVIWRDGATYRGDGTRNEDYHCYGQPQYAPAAGTVVGVMDQYPDDTPGAVTEVDPATHPAGNHIVIEVAENEYVLMAHFQPGTIAVAEGDTITAGDPVGLTGNSGNSSEPHIHIHMQSGPDMLDPSTFGLPMVFENLRVNGEPNDAATVLQGQIIEPVSP